METSIDHVDSWLDRRLRRRSLDDMRTGCWCPTSTDTRRAVVCADSGNLQPHMKKIPIATDIPITRNTGSVMQRFGTGNESPMATNVVHVVNIFSKY